MLGLSVHLLSLLPIYPFAHVVVLERGCRATNGFLRTRHWSLHLKKTQHEILTRMRSYNRKKKIKQQNFGNFEGNRKTSALDFPFFCHILDIWPNLTRGQDLIATATLSTTAKKKKHLNMQKKIVGNNPCLINHCLTYGTSTLTEILHVWWNVAVS